MYTEALKRMGMFRVLNQGVVQYNSVVFRVVAGVLGLLPLETVAVVSMIEKLLNAALEVPTGFLADKYGRVKSASWGLYLIILGLCALYAAILFNDYKTLSYALIIIDGICLGIAVPLTSGSIDAFYQEALEKYSNEKEDADQSFTLSARYGKWVPFTAILSAFVILYVLNLFNQAHHAFAIGILFWCYVLIQLKRDAHLLGDDSEKRNDHKADEKYDNLKYSLTQIVSSKPLRKSLVMTCLFRTFSMMILGFFIITLGRVYRDQYQHTYFILMAAFFLGCFGPGWYIISTKLPEWIEELSENQYILRLFLGSIAFNAIFLLTYSKMNFVFLTIFLMAYGAFFMVKIIGLQNLSKNILLKEVHKNDYAKYLSLLSMFGLGSSGLYALYVSLFKNGAPSLNEMAGTSLAIILIGIVTLYQKEPNGREAYEQ